MSLHPRAQIHLANIVANWRAIAALTPGSRPGAVVKANAYGHGALQVGKALFEAGCRDFFVAYMDEGIELRDVVESDARIFVFNGADPKDHKQVKAAGLIPVMNSMIDINDWRRWGAPSDFAVHVDTGMNRLGVRIQDLSRLVEATRIDRPVLVMSHLVDSDAPGDPVNAHQLALFRDAVEALPKMSRSLANTGGCYLGPDYGFDITRPGIGLYGGGPAAPSGTTILPGMTLEAPILTVQNVQPGETVGYGGDWTFSEPRTLATVALGYGDGFPRSASSRGYASLGGIACRIVGRVSMDLITIDVTSAADLAIPGAFAQFIGPEVPLEDQAKRAGTVGYELVTGLGHRVRRIYD